MNPVSICSTGLVAGRRAGLSKGMAAILFLRISPYEQPKPGSVHQHQRCPIVIVAAIVVVAGVIVAVVVARVQFE